MFGTRITVDHRLKRRFGERSKKFWSVVKIPLTEVIVIGERTLSDGIHETSGYGEDYESYYRPESYFKVLLVVADIRHNPFYVLLDAPANPAKETDQ